MTVALKARPAHDYREDYEWFDNWMSMTPAERETAIKRMRELAPGAVELVDAFERHHRKLLARAA
ncbi:hypothetical protein [Nitrobacter sp. TKz-YC02]|uniref:hypothetical protein n=1 Tax=Nitrobacter sp. TKz-YC02 TaxID=3398704 RepID=UPI003CF971FF